TLPPAFTADGGSASASVSADGRYVAFISTALDLTEPPPVRDFFFHVYLKDLVAGTTTLVDKVYGRSIQPVVSADGRFVAYVKDTPGPSGPSTRDDLYLYNRQTGASTLVSAGPTGGPGDGNSFDPVVTPDGRFVLFRSSSRNLVPGFLKGAGNTRDDLFVRDVVAGTTALVSVNSAGTAGGNGDSANSGRTYAISDDGRYVTFQSDASDLVPGDANHATDVFLRDLVARTTTVVSANAAGAGSGDRTSSSPSISGDGRFVTYASSATNLVAGNPSPEFRGVYVLDRAKGTTTLVSRGSDQIGTAVTDGDIPVISHDGRLVAFTSVSGSPYPGATNVYVVGSSGGSAPALVSVAGDGRTRGDARSDHPVFSADGGTLVFQSNSSNLVPGNFHTGFVGTVPVGLYVRDLTRGTTTLASANDSGTGAANRDATNQSVSADGSTVVFESTATDLDVRDTNGQSDVFAFHAVVAGTAAIRGRVFDDANGNGAADPGEAGLAGVTVFLDANGNGALDPGETAQVTDAGGGFAFTGLAPGAYTVAEVV
ncbi:MAG: hypothetical protein LC708_00605, partial [Actinobacteria bacterium]|nr:hypothetical protein [Actinomycetota bacterium]